MKLFATCARGLENVLADELLAINAEQVEAGRGGVQFHGDTAVLYRANLWLRTAIRVLVQILEIPVQSTDDLYAAVQTIDWSYYMTPEHTLAVDCNVRDSEITHSMFAALRVKDAICDQFVAKVGRRPSVDTETPMVGLNLHIFRNEATLSLDSSGESLHKRGYRPILTRAPINEALAAGLILLTGWRGDVPLIDPMCGSGTLCIESAWLALNRPPGLTRKRFGFMGWMDYDVALWTHLRDEARRGVAQTLPCVIAGSDIRSDAIHFAETNARAAGIGHLVKFTRRDVADFTPPKGPPGILLINPPYGERLGEEKDLVPLHRTLGNVVRERCPGWTLYVFTGNAFLARQIGIKPSRVLDLFNGKIPCRLLEYRVE
ncbi:MAG: RNA methyltransferase [Gemmataceae bacterium]|nr:RNA methyltransferase [Gemmataceae bacterium]